jgi:glycosyltransferase involved in cell wall biosynthesis
MSTCDGAEFLRPQVDSILAELGDGDELIIVDDASVDATPELLAGYRDRRVRLFRNATRHGHVRTVARAVAAAERLLIVLADQDDVWIHGRLDRLRAALAAEDALVAAGNFVPIAADGTRLPGPARRLHAADSTHAWRNIAGILLGRRPYYGCAMAFKRSLTDLVLPIPVAMESHDLWIAFAGNLAGGMRHLEDDLLLKRSHGRNLSAPRRRNPLRLAISRAGMLYGLCVLGWRLARRRRAAGV